MTVKRSAGFFLAVTYATIIVSCATEIIVHPEEDGKDGPDCLQGKSYCGTLKFAGENTGSDSLVVIESKHVYLDTVVSFIHLKNVSIIGAVNGTIIECNCSVTYGCGFEIVDTSDITLTRLLFSACGFKSVLNGTDIGVMSGLFIASSGNVVLANVTVTRSRGYGVFMMNLRDNISMENCFFKDNSPSMYAPDDVSPGGTGLFILISACAFNSTSCDQSQAVGNYAIDRSVFTNNSIHLNRNISIRIWTLYYGGGLAVLLHWGALRNSFAITRSCFDNNIASVGAGISVMCQGDCSSNKLFVSGSSFDHNHDSEYSLGGVGAAIGFSSINRRNFPTGNIFIVNLSNFTRNQGYYGVGVLLYSTSQPQNSSNDNEIEFQDCLWDGNTGTASPAIEIEPDFLGTLQTSFLVSPVFTDCQFLNNKIIHQHPMNSTTFIEYSGVFLVTKLNVIFNGTTHFHKNVGTALYLNSASIVFQSHSVTEFLSNHGNNGGALALVGFSSIQYNSHIEIHFINNSATFIGGAIYVLSNEQHESLSSHSCFFDYANSYLDPPEVRDARFYFLQNKALSNFGHSIYLTSLQPCQSACFQQTNALQTPDKVFSNDSCLGYFIFDPPDRINNIITGPSNFEVDNMELPLLLVPGRQRSLPVKVFDDYQQNITSATIYTSRLSNPSDSMNVSIDPAFHFIANNTISLLGLPGATGNLTLSAQSFRGTATKISFKMAACPPGYVTSPAVATDPNSTSCQCSTSLSSDSWYNGITGCNDTDGVALLSPGHWIGYIITENFPQESEYNLYTSRCPLGFCKYFYNNTSTRASERFYPLIPQASKQELAELVCTRNREGTLCGQCKDGHSVFFHSDQFKCGPNTLCHIGPLFYLLSELLPITAIFFIIIYSEVNLTSGVAYNIIFLIQVLNPLNISVNGAIKFYPLGLMDFLTVIYRSFNLDFFNLEQLSFCLWSGAHTLDIIVVKYVSILFALGLMAMFIFVKHRATCRCFRMTRFLRRHGLGDSGVRGLSAFLVLCYSQFTYLSFILLAFQPLTGKGGAVFNGTNVVFLDGSLDYFEGKHLYYVLPALVCVLLIVIPLPLLLFCDPYLIKCESVLARHRFLKNLQPWTLLRVKFKPVFDTFQGCFRNKYRQFAGLYFAYRLVIYLMAVIIPSTIDFYFSLELFLIVILALQAIAMPFEVTKHNIIAILIFSCLLMINTLTINIYYHVLLHGYTAYVTVLQWIQFLFSCSPIIFCILAVAQSIVTKVKHGSYSYQRGTDHEEDERSEFSVPDIMYERMDDDLEIVWSNE